MGVRKIILKYFDKRIDKNQKGLIFVLSIHAKRNLIMKQVVKLSPNAGSLVNYLMGNNSSLPVVGEGATLLSYTDRRACEVVSVSEDSRTVTLESLTAIRTDKNGMSEDQDYRYEPTGNQFTIVWRNSAWRRDCTEIWYTDEALNMDWKERKAKCIDPETGMPKLVPGLTFIKKSYPKISIVFGVKQAYHDFSF